MLEASPANHGFEKGVALVVRHKHASEIVGVRRLDEPVRPRTS